MTLVAIGAGGGGGGGGGGGALGVCNELMRKGVGGVMHTIWNLWVVSTNVVFEHTTSVAISKNQLQGLLIVFLHGFLILAHLRVEGGHLILNPPELLQK